MGYKVVRQAGDQFFSVVVEDTDYRKQYKIGEWTEVERTMGEWKLTYFRNLRDAKNFVYQFQYRSDIKIFKCKVKGITNTRNLPACYRVSMTGSICVDEYAQWPDRTYMAEKIKPIEEIKI